MNKQVSLGPLTRCLMQEGKWTDQYPLTQALADELEQLLELAEDYRVSADYHPRLGASERQRNAGLDELRVARFLALNGFPPLAGTWKPNGGANADGEFTVQESPGGIPVLVEVKRRSWQSELSEEEMGAGRAREPKRKHLAGAVPVTQPIRAAIDKAYPKFTDQTAGLLVIEGEDFRLPLSSLAEERAGQALYSPLPNDRGYFTDSRYENLGGLGIFWSESDGQAPVPYKMELYVNAFALPATRLPHDLVKALRGIRLWDDPTEPNQALKSKRLGGDDRLERDRILKILGAKRDALRGYGIRHLSLFGSAARGENDPASDLDFLVELDPKTFAGYMEVKEYLEDLFGCRVDLVLSEAIKPALRESILRECVHAAGL